MADDERIFADLREARRRLTEEPVTHTHAAAQAGPAMLGDVATVIEGYSITRELGRGGMGVVFEAIQQRLSRKVALKILPGSAGLRDRDALDRFQREATAAARLHHTNIVPVYDYGQSGTSHFYAMELVEGRPLTEMIRRLAAANAPTATQERLDHILRDATDVETPGSSATINKVDSFGGSGSGSGSSAAGRGRVYYRHVARWMADAADALNYAHDQGIIHRDIKPSNLLLACDGRIMILDFGLAKTHGDHSVTMTGAIVGTLRYMSPEQAMAKRMKVDHRTDIYSLGATMYELLTFQPAFAGSDDKETLGLIITRDATAPRKISGTVPRELETICLKTLEKDPAARYATAKALADDLRCFIDDRPISAKAPGSIGRAVKYMRRRRAATVAVAASVLLIVTGVFAYSGHVKSVESERQRLKEQGEIRVKRVKELVESGGKLMRADLVSAERPFRDALALDPTNYLALVNLANILRYRFDNSKSSDDSDERARAPEYWNEAFKLVNQAIANEPDNLRGRAYNIMGVLLRKAGRHREADLAHKKGADLNPKYYANWTSWANLFIEEGKLEDAEDALVKGAEYAPENEAGMPWCNLAAVQLHRKKKESLATCKEAIRRNSKGPEVASTLLMAKILLTLPGSEDAKRAYDKAAAAAEFPEGAKNARVRWIKALAELRLGQFADAVTSRSRGYQAQRPNPYPYLIAAIAEAHLGHSDKAHDLLVQTEPLWPKVSAKPFVDPRGNIWIESTVDLENLRKEAEALLNPSKTQTSQPVDKHPSPP